MVELGVATISFGKPFNERVDATGRVRPCPPEPKFPGVSPTAFDPAKQVQVYGDMIKKDTLLRGKGQELEFKVAELRNQQTEGTLQSNALARCGDVMPGLDSLNNYYKILGYVRHPISGKPVLEQDLKEPGLNLPMQRRRAPQSQVRSDISSLLDVARRSSSLTASAPLLGSQLSAQAPRLERNFSDVSTRTPVLGAQRSSAPARSASVPLGSLSPQGARSARLRAILLEANAPSSPQAHATPFKIASPGGAWGGSMEPRSPKTPFR